MASPSTYNQATVTAEIRAASGGSTIDLGSRGAGTVDIAALHASQPNSRLRANAAGFISGAGADSSHTIVSAVTAAVRDNVDLQGRLIDIGADNVVNKPELGGDGLNLSGSAKSLVSGTGADSNTLLTLNTIVDIDDADITVLGNPGTEPVLLLHAKNQIDAVERVAFEAAGAAGRVAA